MPAAIGIKKFRPGDLSRIAAIEDACFGPHAWPRELLAEYAESCPSLFLVARTGRTIAGYSIVCATSEKGELVSIAVSPSRRRRGVAESLIAHSVRELQSTGALSISLMVRRDNAPAIRLYHRLGFRRARTVQGYYEDGAAGWRMRLSL